MHSAIINVMSAAAIKAGKGLVRDFGEVGQLQISRKGPSNFVTKSDIRTEKLLQRELSQARPGYGFLMEEGGEVAGTDVAHRWIIDPIDGTTNFIHAIPYFCISIALEKRVGDKSEILAGVIFDPIHNELFTAEAGKGALMNGKKLSVSAREEFDGAMVVVGNHRLAPTATRDEAFARYDQITQCGATIRNFGALALDMAQLAAGRIDVCMDYTFKPWDIAAGILLVREAGGVVSAPDGKPIDIYAPSLLAANRSLHPSVQKLLAKAA